MKKCYLTISLHMQACNNVELYLASFPSNIPVCSFSCCCSIHFLCLKLWCDSREGSDQSHNAHHSTCLPVTEVAQGF